MLFQIVVKLTKDSQNLNICCYKKREIVSKRQLKELLSDEYKNVLCSEMKLYIGLDSISKSDIKNILQNNDIEANINRIIWYLYKKYNGHDFIRNI